MQNEDRRQPALRRWRAYGKLSDSLLGTGAPSLQVLLSLFMLCHQLNRNSALCVVKADREWTTDCSWRGFSKV